MADTRGGKRTAIALTVAVILLAGCADGSNDTATRSTIATAAGSASANTGPSATDSTGDAPAETTGATEATEATGATGATDAADPSGADARYISGDSDYLFDHDQLHTFEITLSEDTLAELDNDPAQEEYVEGSLTFDGEVADPIGVRYKGSIGGFLGCTAGPDPFQPSGERTCTKLSIQLKMNWSDPNAEFYGVRRVQLHSLNLDPTLMHERLGYWVFREMGVPAPRSTHARVLINGEYIGVFALTEEIDGRFTRENFADGTGNLYKEVWPFDVNGAPRNAQQLIAGLETNEDENPNADIMTEFSTELAAATADTALDVIAKWSDVDTLLTMFVVDRAIRNDDGPLHWYCFEECAPHNFYWYEDPSTRKVTLIPWDLDNSFDNLAGGSPTSIVTEIADPFGEITNDCVPFPYGVLSLMQRSAACDPIVGPLSLLTAEYDQIRAELITGPLSPERVAEQLARWSAQIEPAVAEAAAIHTDAPSVEDWQAAVSALQVALDDARSLDGR